MNKASEQDREIALEIIKQWIKEHDAVYLAKENRIVYWQHFSPESKKGEYVKLHPLETCRIIKATRAGFSAMRFVKTDLLLLAAQELERTYKQGIFSRSNAPEEYFNFCRCTHFNKFELLILCILQELVGRGWNIESVCLGKLISNTFEKVGFENPTRIFRWRLINAVADEAGMIVRGRNNRLTVYGVGRFIALQIEGIDDSIKTELSEEEMKELTDKSVTRYSLI